MAKYLPHHRHTEMPESFILDREKIKYLGYVRDWLTLPEQKGKWTLAYDSTEKCQRLYFTDKNTAFACKMRWG
jgi:hypothetical protein